MPVPVRYNKDARHQLDVSMQPEVLSSMSATHAIGALEKWRALACCSALLIQGRPSYTASYAAAPSPLYIQGLSNEAGLSYAATYTAVLARFTFQAGPTYDRNIHDRPSLQTPYCQGPSYQVAHAVALMRDPPHLRALFIRRSVPYLHMVALPPHLPAPPPPTADSADTHSHCSPDMQSCGEGVKKMK